LSDCHFGKSLCFYEWCLDGALWCAMLDGGARGLGMCVRLALGFVFPKWLAKADLGALRHNQAGLGALFLQGISMWI